MATIENLRAKAFGALGIELSKKMPITTFVNGYIVGAQEQDLIARQEERERCIQIAQNFLCCRCIGKDAIDRCAVREACEKRGRIWHIREAIEKGGNQ